MRIYNVYCNTKFDYTKKVGTYAIIIKEDSRVIFSKCDMCDVSKTNNQLDIMASIYAIDVLKKNFHLTKYDFVEVFHNLKTISDAFGGWISKWQENGWINSDGKPVRNQSQWMELLGFYNQYCIRFSYLGNDDKNMRRAKKMIRRSV